MKNQELNLQPDLLEDDITKLVPLKETDFDALFEIASDPLLWEQHPIKDRYKKEVFQTFFDGALNSKGGFLILDALTNEAIGTTRLYDYNTENSNLIVELFRSSYASGFVLNTLNVGANKNEGVEVSLDAGLVQGKNFKWTTRFNFNKMWNKVMELPSNVPEFYQSDTWTYANARGGLVVGGPTTTITSLLRLVYHLLMQHLK